ncbi:hypothetical protein FISHEDRAFT_74695 [Fistulina hepatica ATCC 64428]|uniref:Uncharacterized protein n=1 Tax=Fistulina hepatica ATCC 64428 TaxID=1128425 RepID=A0A0D7A9Q1_9AGAR|nr:hypothetical protein FISHEDRAFT_74695 [Fistulina hepatica ATCC 64428]
MSVRSVRTPSFSIYIDEPASPPAPAPPLSSNSIAAAPVRDSQDSHATPTTIAEKENLDPITGLPRNSTDASKAGKKRKENVLAAKALPLREKEQDVEEAAPPEPKRRKSSRTLVDKRSGSGKSLKSSKTRKISRRLALALPAVEEERAPVSAEEQQRKAVNTRCYELTVVPLADVTAAYDETAAAAAAASTCVDEHTLLKSAVDPAIGDEFDDYLPPTCRSSPAPLLKDELVPITPERPKFGTTFTFASPSSSSSRYKEASRSRSCGPAAADSNKEAC